MITKMIKLSSGVLNTEKRKYIMIRNNQAKKGGAFFKRKRENGGRGGRLSR
jgi:hypothetical protein